MHIAIIDSIAADTSFLYENVCRYCKEKKLHLVIQTFQNDKDFFSACLQTVFHLVFLDIHLENISGGGIAIAKKLRKQFPQCQIIFTTQSREYAIQAFRLHALDYLVKPYTYEQLEDTLNYFDRTIGHFEHYITVKEGRNLTHIPLRKILYTDYSNHYIQIHTLSSVIRSYQSFDTFAPLLAPYPQFLCCYRNCMVNMDYIAALKERDFLLKNGEQLPISKARKKEIIQTYYDYAFLPRENPAH